MNWTSMRGWLGTLARLVVGVVWIWSGVAKLDQPAAFVRTVRAYDATPDWLTKVIGYGLPVLGIVLGILLIVGITTRVAASVSAVLFLVMLIGLIEVAARGIDLKCGAFSVGGPTLESTDYPLYILLVVVLLAGTVFLAWWPMTRLSLEEFVTRHDYVAPPSAKRLRSDQGQRKYLAQVEAKQKEAVARDRYVHGALAIVVVLVAIIGIGVQSGRAKPSSNPSSGNASQKYGVVSGKVAAARIEIYEDFSCTRCARFNQAVAATLAADVTANKAQVHYFPISLYNQSSNGNEYSTRAANAALCAADAGAAAYVKYQDILLGKDSKGAVVQPAVGGKGRPDADLIAYGSQIGITKAQVAAFTTCVQVQSHRALVAALTETASKAGVNTVPVVKVNGKKITASLSALTKAIAAADAKGPAPKPATSSSPASSGAASSGAASSGAASSGAASSGAASSGAASSGAASSGAASSGAGSSGAGSSAAAPSASAAPSSTPAG